MKKSTKVNLIFTLVILALAAVFWLWSALSAPGKIAVVEYGSGGRVELDLRKDGVYDVDTGVYTVHLEVAEGRVRFVDSPCPDHICEGFGWLEKDGDLAVCLPATAICTVEAPE